MKSTTLTKIGSESQYSALKTKHQTFLNKFEQFPENTRKSIYKQLLLLPLNYKHFQELSKPYQTLPQHNLDKQVSYISKCLSVLYPQLNNQWVPGMIYPFVKLFKQDSILCFQISLTFLLNTLFPILQNYPQPPKSIMDIFEDYLPDLTNHVESLEYPLSSIINPTFVVSLTDILNKKDWLTIFDYLAVNVTNPSLYYCVAMAVIKSIEKKLLNLGSVEEIAISLRREKNLSINNILLEAERLSQNYSQQFENLFQKKFFPISSGRYPVFTFIKDKIRLTNDKLEHSDDSQLQNLQNKMDRLSILMSKHMNSALYSDQKQINDRYELVEGQMQQYLSKIKEEHANKIKALREIEDNFNQQVRDKSDKRDPKNVLDAIERRARLQKQIQGMMREAESIKEMEKEMVERMRDVAKIRKQELEAKSNNLRKINNRY